MCASPQFILNHYMGKLIINSYDEFAAYEGKELGVSDWLQIDQDRINLFADATLDHQWIHVDVERAKEESQYHSTIAHGYLTLSVLPHLWAQIIDQDARELRHGQDALRTACDHGVEDSHDGEAAQHPEPAWHLQGGD